LLAFFFPSLGVSQQSQVEESDLLDISSPLIASVSDDYVHIEVEPPEGPLPETDLKLQQQMKQQCQDFADQLESKLLAVDEKLSALKSAPPTPQTQEQEQTLREESEAIIDQLQGFFEGRQVLEKPHIQKRRLQPDLSLLDQHQRALMEQQRLLDALMTQVRFSTSLSLIAALFALLLLTCVARVMC